MVADADASVEVADDFSGEKITDEIVAVLVGVIAVEAASSSQLSNFFTVGVERLVEWRPPPLSPRGCLYC